VNTKVGKMMEIIVPKKYVKIFEGLPLEVYKVEWIKGDIKITMPIGYVLSKERTGMTTKQFRELFKKIKVVRDGRKIWQSSRIIFEPSKTKYLHVRVTEGELILIRKVAAMKGMSVSRYVVGSVIEKVLKDLQESSET
jgi:predicted DNA binding CopG/RHH family protein